jgi:hypothetical protein
MQGLQGQKKNTSNKLLSQLKDLGPVDTKDSKNTGLDSTARRFDEHKNRNAFDDLF